MDSNERIVGGVDRLRSTYHKLSLRHHPENIEYAPVVCDVCGVELFIPPSSPAPTSGDAAVKMPLPRPAPRWHHRLGKLHDLCGKHYDAWVANGGVYPEQQGQQQPQQEEQEGEERPDATQCGETLPQGFVQVEALEDLQRDRHMYEYALEKRQMHLDARVKFAQVALAYVTLKDPERMRIVYLHGFKGLRLSEAYSEVSVFDQDPYQVCVLLSSIFNSSTVDCH